MLIYSILQGVSKTRLLYYSNFLLDLRHQTMNIVNKQQSEMMQKDARQAFLGLPIRCFHPYYDGKELSIVIEVKLSEGKIPKPWYGLVLQDGWWILSRKYPC